jgi:tRNA-2-methylthio-N6-dimethylallyladenosine synthase
MNEHDTRKMRLLLSRKGYSTAEDQDSADLVIFNTCTIREKAYHKAISEIGRARIFKRRRPGQVIAVCGCAAQQEGTNIFGLFPHVDIVFGPDQIDKLPSLIDRLCSVKTAAALELVNTVEEYKFLDDVPPAAESGQAFVTVTKGCNCSCTYCIVPLVRGREVSRKSDDIINEVRALVFAGVKEVTLLGQNVTSYNSGGLTLAGLISRLSKETEVKRIRFTSPHPKDVTDALIDEYARNEKLCPHIHLPAQSGSDAMLKKMGRGYTRKKYLEIVGKLRRARPGISITSDFIAGFCGETEDDFNQTMGLLKDVLFDSIFAFRYSARPGTAAYRRFADDVPSDVKEKRLEKILSFQREITLSKNEALAGETGEVLVTGPDRKNSGKLMGRLPDNRIVNFAGNPSAVGSIVRVRLTKGLANSMEGECLDE